VILVVTW